LQAACEYLKSSAERFDYPSAYLVPSLYCQPQSALFRIQRKGWRQTWELWRPTLPEAVVVGGIAVLCLMYPIQDFLMQRRLLAEAVYRNVTGQIQSGKTPPILLVTIDKASARQIDAYKTERIDRTYLARLIHQAVNLKPTVIGVDYFLDKRTYKEDDKALSMAIQDAVQQHNTRFIFGSREDSIEGEVGITPEIAPLNRLMQGRINFTPWYVELPSANTDCVKSCPFAYLLALTHAATEAFPANTLPQARLQGSVSLRTQLVHKIQQLSTTNQKLMFVKHAQLLPLTQSSKALNDIYQYLDQRWLQPIIDFSIPPEDVYRRIPAKDFLTSESIASNSHKFKQQIVLIIPYAYEEAGVTTGSDNFQAPLATIYWREKQSQNQIRRSDEILPGGEAHAYVVHHLLSQRLVKPIPDLWMIGVGVLLGKGLALLLSSKSRYESRKWLVLLVVATGAYGLAGLQVFVSGAILLPYFFPLVVFWIYLVPTLRRALYERL